MKKVLSIVLAVCMLAGLCVGLSLSGSAAIAMPVRPDGAVNYAVDASSTPVANFGDTDSSWDATTKTLTFAKKGDNLGYNFGVPAEVLEGEYVFKMQLTAPGAWGPGMFDVILSDSFKFQVSKVGFYKDGETVKGGMWDWIVSGYGQTITLYFHVIPEEGKTTKTVQVYLDAEKADWTDEAWEYTGVDMTGARIELLSTSENYNVMHPNGTPEAVRPTDWGGAVSIPAVDIWSVAKKETTTSSTTQSTTESTTSSSTTESTTESTTGTTATQKPSGVVDGVDLDKKGTGKDEAIKGFETVGKNQANASKTEVTGKAEIAKDGTVTVPKESSVKFDLSGIKATDDFVIKFTMATNAGWPHCKHNVIFGTNADATEVQGVGIRGNVNNQGITYEFPWVYTCGGTAVDMRVPVDNTTQDTEYTIFVTTSKETGLRRIFFFANGKLFKVQTAIDKAEKDVEIKDQKCLTPTLIFQNPGWVDYPSVYKNVEVYKAKAAEPKVDKTYTTAPIANKGAKNYVDLSKATAKGSAVVDAAAGKFLTGTGEDSTVTIPLNLKKTDSYVVSFMTKLCEWDPWQPISVVFAKDGDKELSLQIMGARQPGNDTFCTYRDPAIGEQRLQSISNMGEMTKVDILVTNSVETGKRRVIIFQDGKIMQTYSPQPSNWDVKTAEALTPTLIFRTAGYSHEVTNLKVFKLSDAKGESGNGGSAGTGNASTAVAAVAVTAAIALPVIFVAKKKRKEEE